MFGLFGKDENVKTVAILEMGTGSVGGALVRLRSAGGPEILAMERVALPVRDVRSGKILSHDLLKALAEALQKIKHRAALHTEGTRVTPQRIEHAVVLLGAPWSRPTLRTLRLSRTEPFVVKEDILERILEGDKGRKGESEEKGFSLIENAVVALRLNGYPVTRFVPSKVTIAETTLWTTHADTKLMEGVKGTVEEHLPHAPRTIHSFALASYFGISRAFAGISSYIHLDVTAEVTEATLVRDGVPLSVGFFPQGRNLLLRTLKAQGLPEHEALSALSLVGKETSRMKDKVGKSLSHVASDWRVHLRELLLSLTSTVALPKTLFLSAPADVGEWFRETLESEEMLSALTPGKSRIILLSPRTLKGSVGGAGEGSEAATLLGSIFADARFDERTSFEILSTRSVLYAPSQEMSYTP